MNLKEYKLDELYRMDSGISTTKEQAGHGEPFVSFRDIFNNYILPETLTEKMDTSEAEQEKYSVKKGDVFITRTSETLDELAMSSVAIKDYPKATFSGFAKRLRPITENIVYDKYMAFFLRSEYFRKVINCKAVMTLRASFNEEIFSYIKIMLPEYDYQVKCGDLLYSFERKIRLNNKIINNLEAMAKTIYDYWFLQFEFPNEEGKPYKSSGGKMVYNEELKKEIPEGWQCQTINDVIDMVQGYAFSNSDYSNKGTYKLYTIKNVQDGEIISKVDNNIKKIPDNMSEECMLKPLDIIMSLTGNVGRVGLVYENNALLNQRVLKIKPKNNNTLYTYLLFRDINMKSKLENIATGTSQKNLSPVDMGNLKCVIPDNKVLKKFQENNNIIQTLVNYKIENQELQNLRDYLLPLLVNGQVSFKN